MNITLEQIQNLKSFVDQLKTPIVIIEVENLFEVVNGLTGMLRDVNLRLCHLFWYETKKVRQIIGVSVEHYGWKLHKHFLNARPNNIPVVFRRNPYRRLYKLTHTRAGATTCHFADFDFDGCTVFLNTRISAGIVRWTVQINYGKEKDAILLLGAAPAEDLDYFNGWYLNGSKASCSFQMVRNSEGSLESSFLGTSDNESFLEENSHVPQNSAVSVEADADARTLAFFVNKRKVPHMLSNVRVPFHLGMSGESGAPSFTTLFFRRLPSSTPSAVVCKMHKAKNEE